jgi:hypothetical protein
MSKRRINSIASECRTEVVEEEAVVVVVLVLV